MNVAVILAAGKSSRFESQVPKQLYTINDKTVIEHSIDILSQFVDRIVIVTNTDCFNKIKTNHTVLINDVDDRIQSIKTSIDHLKNGNYKNIILHDAARPFIKPEYVFQLLESSKKYQHSQYYLELVNGLAQKSEGGWKIAPRDQFIELCSPQITDFELFKEIFTNYIETKKDCEMLPIISKLGYNYNLIKGNNKYLRKITTIDDIQY